jgi:hypothetical protein
VAAHGRSARSSTSGPSSNPGFYPLCSCPPVIIAHITCTTHRRPFPSSQSFLPSCMLPLSHYPPRRVVCPSCRAYIHPVRAFHTQILLHYDAFACRAPAHTHCPVTYHTDHYSTATKSFEPIFTMGRKLSRWLEDILATKQNKGQKLRFQDNTTLVHRFLRLRRFRNI